MSLGTDRHGRRYWFVCRRIVVESIDGVSPVWYYSCPAQFEQLLLALDRIDLEADLFAELYTRRDTILRQMQLTETMSRDRKGSRHSSWLDLKTAEILAQFKVCIGIIASFSSTHI